jgi:hypothetical protein
LSRNSLLKFEVAFSIALSLPDITLDKSVHQQQQKSFSTNTKVHGHDCILPPAAAADYSLQPSRVMALQE